jgi:hypothetical protein
MPGVLLALAFSVHMVTTVIVMGQVAAGFAYLAVSRRWPEAWRLALIGTIALIPFGVAMVLQLSTIMANTQTFWIPPGLNAARWSIETELSDAALGNPLLALCAGVGIILLLAGAVRRDPTSRAPCAQIATLAFGLVLALIVLVAAHLHRPLLITRYLIALDPVVALMVALGAERLAQKLSLRSLAALDAALLAMTGLAIHANLSTTRNQWSWNGTSRIIAAQVRACPDTRVYPDMAWDGETLNSAPHDNREVLPFAYATMARRMGFALSPADSHRLSTTCPTLFWTEHAALMHPDATTVIHGLRAAGYPVTSGRMVRRDIGWVLITPPVG